MRRSAVTAALAGCLGGGAALAQTPDAAADQAVLEAFYDATGGTNWTNDTNWKTSASLDDWYGVTTDSSGRVTELQLYFNGLTGSIPPELGSLASLGRLSLARNDLTGEIPNALGGLENLWHLNLSGNELSGPVPAWLGDMARLRYLYLFSNRLTGGIPDSLSRLDLLSLVSG